MCIVCINIVLLLVVVIFSASYEYFVVYSKSLVVCCVYIYFLHTLYTHITTYYCALVMGDGVPCYGVLEIVGLLILLLLLLLSSS